MQRFQELIHKVQEKHPGDNFFADLDLTFRVSPPARATFCAYDRAFQCLDPESWQELSKKAICHFLHHRNGQLKQGFFNQLNEAFAYQYLVRRGYTGVRILPETGQRQPDIVFYNRCRHDYCEVKTIGISDLEISRRSTPMFDGSIYYDLTPEFLQKLDSAMTNALDQIRSQNASGLVYLIVNFDDFTLCYYERYRRQLFTCIQAHEAPFVVAKIGLLGQRRIVKQFERQRQ